jgi:MFS transporter, CP family, cyanate transporter
VLIALASGLRGLGSSTAMLFGMTFLMGVGIAVAQPAMPSLVGAWFPKSIARTTAIYANGLLVGEALSAGLTIPFVLPLVAGSWQASLTVWAVPVLITAFLVWRTTAEMPAARGAARLHWLPDWRSPTTWQLGLLQGGGSITYFGANAFLPDYLHATCRPETIAPALALLNLAQLPASVILLVYGRAFAGRRRPLLAIGVLALVALGLMLAPSSGLVIAGAALIGFCGALLMVLALALPPMLTAADDVHRLSAGMFTIGYAAAFVIPLAGGALWDATHVPAAAFTPVALGALFALASAATLRLRGNLRG